MKHPVRELLLAAFIWDVIRVDVARYYAITTRFDSLLVYCETGSKKRNGEDEDHENSNCSVNAEGFQAWQYLETYRVIYEMVGRS